MLLSMYTRKSAASVNSAIWPASSHADPPQYA